MSDDEDDEPIERMESVQMQFGEVEWFTTHHEVLAEIYKIFRDSGELTFGSWFFQNGGLHDFAHFVYAHSALSSKR